MSAPANRAAATLARLLKQRGEEIALRRHVGTTTQSWVEVRLPAVVRGMNPDELVGGIDQTNYMVSLAYADLRRAKWPGGKTPRAIVSGQAVDDAMPAQNDKCLLRGTVRNVEAVSPVFMAGVCVRVDLRVKG